MLAAGSIVGALYHKLSTQSSAPEDGRNYRPKHVELIGIINKPLLLPLVDCLYYCIPIAFFFIIPYCKTFLRRHYDLDNKPLAIPLSSRE